MTGIRFSAVTAGYGTLQVLHDVDLDVGQGFTVLLGPNGCGKTTLFRTGCGILEPDSGTVTIDGRDPYTEVTAKRSVNYLPHRPVLASGLTVRENLKFWGQIQDLSRDTCERRIEELAARFEFADLLDRRATKLSRGQSQRASVGQALLADPAVLFLDEATTGLDPMIARDIRSYLDQLGNERTVIYSTHDLNEANELADRLLVMRDGQIIFDGNIEDIRENALEQTRVGLDVSQPGEAERVLEREGYDPVRDGAYLVIERRSGDQVGDVVTLLTQNAVNVREVTMMENTVQSVYERLEQENE